MKVHVLNLKIKVTFYIKKKIVGQVVKNNGRLYIPQTFSFFWSLWTEPQTGKKNAVLSHSPMLDFLGLDMTDSTLATGGLGVQPKFGWDSDSTTY